MKTSDITNALFLQAVEAIDSGDIATLKKLIADNPYLVTDQLQTTEEGYFKDPYLLWFVADNPIRHEKLPVNIVEVTNALIDEVKAKAPDTAQHQLDYCLVLVASGRIPRECGVQLAMMDALINAGAKPGNGMAALSQGNTEAANYLIERGGNLSLGTAIVLRRTDDVTRLLQTATEDEKLVAITVAAFYGMPDMVKLLLDNGVNPNGYPDADSGFHAHATPLHQAVSSGSLETVRVLVEAGADLNATDKVHAGTPLGWADYMKSEGGSEEALRKYAEIEAYLRAQHISEH